MPISRHAWVDGLLFWLLLLVTTATTACLGHAGAAGAQPGSELPLVAFTQAMVAVIEPDSGEIQSVDLRVIISMAPAPGADVKVRYATVDGNAVAGIDYEAATGLLLFPANSTQGQTLSIRILGNNRYEGDRAFAVFLTNPENATVGVPAAVIVTIIDNETPPGALTHKQHLPYVTDYGALSSSGYQPLIASDKPRPQPPTPTATPGPYPVPPTATPTRPPYPYP